MCRRWAAVIFLQPTTTRRKSKNKKQQKPSWLWCKPTSSRVSTHTDVGRVQGKGVRLRVRSSPCLRLDQLYHSRHWLLTDFNYDPQELIWLLAVYPFLPPSVEANYAWVAVDEQWTLLMALGFSLCVHITEGYGLWNEITTDYCAISDCAIKHYGPEHSKLCDCGVAGCLLL